jgi:hypothetical protein
MLGSVSDLDTCVPPPSDISAALAVVSMCSLGEEAISLAKVPMKKYSGRLFPVAFSVETKRIDKGSML